MPAIPCRPSRYLVKDPRGGIEKVKRALSCGLSIDQIARTYRVERHRVEFFVSRIREEESRARGSISRETSSVIRAVQTKIPIRGQTGERPDPKVGL